MPFWEPNNNRDSILATLLFPPFLCFGGKPSRHVILVCLVTAGYLRAASGFAQGCPSEWQSAGVIQMGMPGSTHIRYWGCRRYAHMRGVISIVTPLWLGHTCTHGSVGEKGWFGWTDPDEGGSCCSDPAAVPVDWDRVQNLASRCCREGPKLWDMVLSLWHSFSSHLGSYLVLTLSHSQACFVLFPVQSYLIPVYTYLFVV